MAKIALSWNIPPDKLAIQTYCNSKLTAVVCLICNKLYHGSCYSALSEKYYITNTLIICPDYENTNLTLNLNEDIDSISEKARFIIAQIKSMEKSKIKQDILNEISNKTQKGHNHTFIEDETENETLKIENAILRQLNAELMDKNRLLKECRDIEKSKEIKAPTKTFVPKLIVKKLSKEDTNNIKGYVTKCLMNNTSIHTKGIIQKSEEELIINCVDEKSDNVAVAVLTQNLATCCLIEKGHQ